MSIKEKTFSDYCGWNIKDLVNEPCNHTYKTFHTAKMSFHTKNAKKRIVLNVNEYQHS